MLPRPLAASPSSVWSAWPLAALSHASARRAGAWPLRPSGAAAARLRPLASAVSRRLVLRRPLWRVLVAANAVFFSPLTTPLFSPWRWRAAMRKISVRGAKNSCAPARLKTGGLVAGVARALAAFAATVRKRLASRPLAVRAPLAAPCAPSRAFARRSPPSSGGQARVVKGVQSSSVSAWGTGTRLPALRSPPLAAIQPKPRGKAKGGRFHPRLYTKFCVQKIPGQKNTGRGRRGTAPANAIKKRPP